MTQAKTMKNPLLRSGGRKKGAITKRLILIAAFGVLFICSACIGAYERDGVHFWKYFSAIFTGDAGALDIIKSAYLPRTIAITLSAASLVLSGQIMQTIGRNNLISPQTIGTTSAAKLGVMITYVSSIGVRLSVFTSLDIQYINIIFAFVFAMVFTVLFMTVLSKIKMRDTIYIPLVGMMMAAVIEGICVFVSDANGMLQTLNDLNNGSYSLVGAGNYETMFLLLIPVVIGVLCAAAFSIVGMGEDFAKNLGVNYKLFTYIGILVVSVISAINFVMVGPIPFLGLIIPNLVKTFYGDNIKRSVWELMLFGISFVLLCDIVSRLIVFPYELPVSLIIGVLGGIIFLGIIFSRVKAKK